MQDYATRIRDFDAARMARDVLSGRPEAMNACVECCDRHAGAGAVALHWIGRDGQRAEWTFEQLQQASARLAGHFHARGIRAGDRISGLLPRTPELLVTILATWRIGAVYQPLFTAFGPKAIEHRVQMAASKLVVTDAAQRPKMDDVAGSPRCSPWTAISGRCWMPIRPTSIPCRAARTTRSC